MVKRLFDLLGATLALLLLSPLLLVAALAVRLDSPGPVFYRQQRVGRGGVPFSIHKFRTMCHGAGGPLLTDELPQFIDVLLGHMSLVGPRPEVPRFVALYPPELRARVLAVRPGITDPASLAFIDEARLLAAAADPEREYVQVILPAKLQHAAEYAERASLATDLGVLWRTLRLLLRQV